jgi:hypothetical protein
MASKMENWIAFQQRHLTPEAFEAWKQSDVKVQSWLKKQEGASHAIRQLEDFQKNILKKVIAPGLQRASDWLASIEKTGAAGDKDSGVLMQSIGSTKAKVYPASFCGYVASGPRRGYARAVQIVVNKKGAARRKRLSAKGTQAAAAKAAQENTKTTLKNPVAYARFLRRGRKAIVARGQRGAILLAKEGGTFFRHGVKAAPPHDFMRSAQMATQSAAAMATCEMQLNLQKLTSE